MLTRQQSAELTVLAEPVVKWLNNNCHPHTVVVLETDGVTVYEGISHTPITKYIGDNYAIIKTRSVSST